MTNIFKRNKGSAIVLLFLIMLLAFMLIPIKVFAKDFGSNVTVEIEASEMSVKYPTDIAFVFNSDGTNTYPTNYSISNGSISPIQWSSIDITQENNNWQAVNLSDYKAVTDSKQIRFGMGTSEHKPFAEDKTIDLNKEDSSHNVIMGGLSF